MPSYSRAHLADHVLLRALTTAVSQDRATTAEMLALIAEVEHRRLYAGEGFSSMYRYCVEKLLMSEDVACKRILTARAARRFAAIIPAIAEGRLTVSTVALLSTHLKTEHGGAILSQALGKTRADVELLIAERFPVPTTLVPVACSAVPTQVEPPQNDTLALAEASAQVVANTGRHGREPAIALPRAQPARGRTHIWRGVHGGEASAERLARRAHLQLSTPASHLDARSCRLTPPATSRATRALPGTRAMSSLP
jgi:hypothetical protein